MAYQPVAALSLTRLGPELWPEPQSLQPEVQLSSLDLQLLRLVALSSLLALASVSALVSSRSGCLRLARLT